MKKYYFAYDDRYKQTHKNGYLWEVEENSKIVLDTILKYNITKDMKILDMGVGEGRDSIFLLKKGYKVKGIDCSIEAIKTCKELAEKKKLTNIDFEVVDVVKDNMQKDIKFDFIYSIAVLHMLCEDDDRKGFFKFVKKHLSNNGIALICVMGDGEKEYLSDYKNAFELSPRNNINSNNVSLVASTSLKMVSKETFLKEIKENNFEIIDYFVTSLVPNFSQMMAVIIK